MSPASAALTPGADDSYGIDVLSRRMVVDHYEAPRVDSPLRLSIVGLAERMQFSHSALHLRAGQATFGQAVFGVKGPCKALDGHTIEITQGLGRYFRGGPKDQAL